MSLCEKGCKSTSEVAGCSRCNLVLSLSLMNTTWLNTAGDCCPETLSDARISDDDVDSAYFV